MPPVIKLFPHVLKSILYTFLYTFSRRLMTYSGKYLPEFFRLSPMKLVGFTCFYPTVSHNFCSGMIKSSGHVHYSLLTSCCVSLVACRSVIALRFFFARQTERDFFRLITLPPDTSVYPMCGKHLIQQTRQSVFWSFMAFLAPW